MVRAVTVTFWIMLAALMVYIAIGWHVYTACGKLMPGFSD